MSSIKVQLPENEQHELSELIGAAEDHARQHQYDMALRELNRALRYLEDKQANGVEEQRALLRFARAELLMQLGRWEGALEDIDRIFAAEDCLRGSQLLVRALLASSQISANYGDYNEAIASLEKALALVHEHGGPVERARVHLELGTIFSRIGELQQGIQRLDSVLECIPEPPSGEDAATVLAAAYTQKGLSAFRKGSHDEARAHYQKSLEILRQAAPKTRIEADTLRYLGILCSVEGRNAEALLYHRQALVLYGLLRVSLGQAKTYNSIGQTCLDLSRLDEALHFMHKAERLSRKLGADAESAAIYGKLGNIYLQTGDYNRAVEYHLKDIDMCRRFGNYRALAYAMRNLGLSYRGKGDVEEALHYLGESLHRFEELQDRAHIARVHLDLGRTFLERGRLPEAEDHIELGLRSLEGSEQPGADLGRALALMGALQRLCSNAEQAEAFLGRAVRQLQDFGPSADLARAHFELGMLHLDHRHNDAAMDEMKQCLALARELDLRELMLDSLQQIERLDEFELVNLLVEDVRRKSTSSG
ncbi:MAG: tetratricopeptide repeat protein [Armatimonadetes bacterium]|nr:tetratricopeptide repeat protein [Armatimonadota bacterium]